MPLSKRNTALDSTSASDKRPDLPSILPSGGSGDSPSEGGKLRAAEVNTYADSDSEDPPGVGDNYPGA